jgi:OOP family OmpA-OmpF porin
MLALFVPGVMAQTTEKEGYLTDSAGNFVYSSTPNQCWHTGTWTPAMALEPCDPVIKKMALAPIPTPPPKAAAPAPVAAAPVVVAALPKPLPTRLSLSADALFAFDKYSLNSTGEALLSDLAVQIKAADAYRIVVTGHTDRIGSTAYNQKLSEQRANTVRDYLTGKGAVSALITTSGKGETEPMTTTEVCKGRISPKLIACLQPDRRVDIDIEGSTTATR